MVIPTIEKVKNVRMIRNWCKQCKKKNPTSKREVRKYKLSDYKQSLRIGKIIFPCNIYPFTPHFHIAKQGFTGYTYFFFLICASKHTLWVLVRTAFARRKRVPLKKNIKDIKIFLVKFSFLQLYIAWACFPVSVYEKRQVISSLSLVIFLFVLTAQLAEIF